MSSDVIGQRLNGHPEPADWLEQGDGNGRHRGTSLLPQRRLFTTNLVILLVLVLVASAGVAFALTRVAPSYYGGRAVIAFNSPASGDTTSAQRRLETESQVLTGRGLLGPIAEANGIPLDELRRRVSTSISSDADVIALTVRDRQPGRALRLTVLVAGAYLTSSAATRPTEEEVSLATNVRNLQARRDQLDAKLADPTLSDSVARGMSTEVSTLTLQIGTLYSQLATAQAQRLSNGRPQLITPPYVLPKPVSPNVLRSMALGGLVGLAIVVCIVLGLYQLRRPTS